MVLLSALLAFTSVFVQPITATPDTDPALVRNLTGASTQAQRIALLADSDFIFDFYNSSVGIAMGKDGHTVGANAGTVSTDYFWLIGC